MNIIQEKPIGNYFKKDNIYLGTLITNHPDLYYLAKEQGALGFEFLNDLITMGALKVEYYDIFYKDENGFTRFVEEGPETFKGDNSDDKGIIKNVIPVWDYYNENELSEIVDDNNNIMRSTNNLEGLEEYNKDYNLEKTKKLIRK